MSAFALLTAFGRDRPGIVATLAEALFHLGCNIEDTCMTQLRGEFTMMIMVRLPAGVTAEQLAERLTLGMNPLGLQLLCRPLPPDAAERRQAADAPVYMISVYGADHPGIVAKVTREVADYRGNITDANTRVIGEADRPIYVMMLEVQMPSEAEAEVLGQALEDLKPALGVDVTFRRLEEVRF
jgi:glycine cleavage system transcriptional repressor